MMLDLTVIVSFAAFQSRNREVKVYDTRNMSCCANTVEIDNATGTLMPLLDADTDMLYLVGKGDNNVRFMQSTDKDPYVVEGTAVRYFEIDILRVFAVLTKVVIPSLSVWWYTYTISFSSIIESCVLFQTPSIVEHFKKKMAYKILQMQNTL